MKFFEEVLGDNFYNRKQFSQQLKRQKYFGEKSTIDFSGPSQNENMSVQILKYKDQKIKVIGVGGAGGNAINSMISENITGVEFIAVNSDFQDLQKSKAKRVIQIGKNIAKLFDKNLVCAGTLRAAWEQEPIFNNRVELSKNKKDIFGIAEFLCLKRALS